MMIIKGSMAKPSCKVRHVRNPTKRRWVGFPTRGQDFGGQGWSLMCNAKQPTIRLLHYMLKLTARGIFHLLERAHELYCRFGNRIV